MQTLASTTKRLLSRHTNPRLHHQTIATITSAWCPTIPNLAIITNVCCLSMPTLASITNGC